MQHTHIHSLQRRTLSDDSLTQYIRITYDVVRVICVCVCVCSNFGHSSDDVKPMTEENKQFLRNVCQIHSTHSLAQRTQQKNTQR